MVVDGSAHTNRRKDYFRSFSSLHWQEKGKERPLIVNYGKEVGGKESGNPLVFGGEVESMCMRRRLVDQPFPLGRLARRTPQPGAVRMSHCHFRPNGSTSSDIPLEFQPNHHHLLHLSPLHPPPSQKRRQVNFFSFFLFRYRRRFPFSQKPVRFNVMVPSGRK